MQIFNSMSMIAIAISGKVQSFILSVLMLAGTVGVILLVAYLINRHITKKEQAQKDEKENK